VTTAADAGRSTPDAFRRPTLKLVLRAVARRLLPNLVEATLIPTLLFVATAMVFSVPMAFLVALVWSYAALLRRVVARRPIPSLVVLGSIGLTVRTLVAIGSGSAFVYFLQPVIGTFVVGSVFLASVAVGRPIIGRFARDFCPLDADIEGCAGIVLLYRRLTYLWATVNFVAGATTFALLRLLPVHVFLAVRPVAVWTITVTGVLLTVVASVRVARLEGLVAVVTPGGWLTAVRP
jgi:hypothetical protein